MMDASPRAPVIALAEGLVKEHMASLDPSHDWYHVDRVRRTALRIARELDKQPDLLVVELVALFHDLAAKYGPTDTLHETLEPFFSSPISHCITKEQKESILFIIPHISWSTEKKLRASGQWGSSLDQCLELQAVQDADRLDAIGSIGIMRCAAYSAKVGRRLVGPDEGDESAESHFGEKLLLIKDRMKTRWGKEEALRRHETMVRFLDGLQREKQS